MVLKRSATDNFSEQERSHLEHEDDVVLLNEDQSKVHVFLDRLNDNANMFGMRFEPSKSKMLLEDWISLKPNLVRAREQPDEADRLLLR